jgi:hypothetical protein
MERPRRRRVPVPPFSREFYEKFLRGPTWQEIRRKKIESVNGACEDCGSCVGLQVHHKTYRNFGGNERKSDLVAVCKECHERRDRIRREVRGTARLSDPSDEFERARVELESVMWGRSRNCWSCGGSLNRATHERCTSCQWLQCGCGACGCNYPH